MVKQGTKEKSDHLKRKMLDELPHIHNALHPSLISIATQTRLQIISAREELKEWVKKNPEKVAEQRAIFRNFLERIQNINNQITKISKK